MVLVNCLLTSGYSQSYFFQVEEYAGNLKCYSFYELYENRDNLKWDSVVSICYNYTGIMEFYASRVIRKKTIKDTVEAIENAVFSDSTFTRLSEVKYLRLEEGGEKHYPMFAKLRKVKYVDLSGNYKKFPAFINAFPDSLCLFMHVHKGSFFKESLEYVDNIRYLYVVANFPKQLLTFPNIEELYLAINSRRLPDIFKYPVLKRVYFYMDYRDEYNNMLLKCKKLEYVEIMHSDMFNPISLCSLVTHPTLKTVVYLYNDTDDVSMDVLKHVHETFKGSGKDILFYSYHSEITPVSKNESKVINSKTLIRFE